MAEDSAARENHRDTKRVSRRHNPSITTTAPRLNHNPSTRARQYLKSVRKRKKSVRRRDPAARTPDTLRNRTRRIQSTRPSARDRERHQ